MADSQTHLLLVDDEPALRTVVAERLREEAFEVTEAESGERAIDLLSEFAFDVVISDLRLPGVGGQRVIEEAVATLSRHHRDRRHRVRHGEGRRRSNQTRRGGFRHQAFSVRRTASRAAHGARTTTLANENAYFASNWMSASVSARCMAAARECVRCSRRSRRLHQPRRPS